MKRCFLALLLMVMTGLANGCRPSAVPASLATAPPLPSSAQPRLPTIKLYLGAQEMTTEVALTPLEQETGMMFRTNIGKNEGMIFVFVQPGRASFWMKNCTVPLSAAYIDAEGTIEEIHPLQPGDTNSVVAAVNNIAYVLETPQGWFQANGVTTGAVIRTEKGSLTDTFWRREKKN